MSTTVIPQKLQRRNRTRAKISGTAARPRLNVHISNRQVTAQLIDDTAGKTLAFVTTVKAADAKGNLTQKATWVGEQIAVLGKKGKITQVVFDRGSRIYHGRLHALAEAARSKGLEF
ncbi:MAG TPA: 50S ribosomal protein L18 [Candidatus Polarisedimenticolaceae bacterium]|nr:50S ribosomal protein L18 [Candidatus Polarisedimenticolaceae bacterium]